MLHLVTDMTYREWLIGQSLGVSGMDAELAVIRADKVIGLLAKEPVRGAKNPFEMHGMDHLSASSCNTWAAAPALWVMERLLGRKSPVGAAAHRGTAVEAGVNMGMLDTSLDPETCVAEAVKVFNGLTALSGDPKRESEGASVPDITRQALRELRGYGKDVVTQERIEWKSEGVVVPYVGYVDYRFPYHQILVDLKTQQRLSSEIKLSHARQVASYAGQYGPNIDARVCYATPKKVATYKLENIPQHIACLGSIGRAIGRFLAISKDPHELAGLLSPDVDSFYYNDPQTRAAAFEIYGV